MRIPADAIIPREKLTGYLLVPRPWDDKSKFLRQAGFTSANPGALLAAIRDLADREDATPGRENEYGEFLRVEGEITGPSDTVLSVVTIWLRWRSDGSVHFVTLTPRRERQT